LISSTPCNVGSQLFAGFANHYAPENSWDTLTDALAQDRHVAAIPPHAAPSSPLVAGQSDFIAGIRAANIDKDRTPDWQPLSDVAIKI